MTIPSCASARIGGCARECVNLCTRMVVVREKRVVASGSRAIAQELKKKYSYCQLRHTLSKQTVASVGALSPCG